MTLCSGLAVFGISGWAINARNHTVQDAFAVGAAKALTVSVHPGVNFLRAVRSADRSGHSAMAVVVEDASDGTTLAVDTREMGQVMSWPPGLGAGGPARVAQQLIPPGLAPPVELSGSALRLSLNASVAAQPAPQCRSTSSTKGSRLPTGRPRGSGRGSQELRGIHSWLVPGDVHSYRFGGDMGSLVGATTPTGTAQVEISSISDLHSGRWESVSAGLKRARRWTSPTGGAELAASSGGLSALFTLNPDAAPVAIAPADIPAALPTVLTTTAAAVDSPSGGPSLIVGLDGASVKAHAIAEVPALPRVGDDAALVDLGMAQRVLSGPFVTTRPRCGSPRMLQRTSPPGWRRRYLGGRHGQCHGTQAESVHSPVNLAYTLFLIAGLNRRGAGDRNNRLRTGRGRPTTRCGACRHAGHRHPQGVAPPLERSGASAGARHRAALRGLAPVWGRQQSPGDLFRSSSPWDRAHRSNLHSQLRC